MKAYSWDFKAEVLAVYEVDGPAAAARAYGVARNTIQTWARVAGLSTSNETKKATESAQAMLARLRAEIRVDLHQALVKLIRRLDEPYEDVRTVDGKPAKVTMDRPPAKESRDFMWAVGVAFDKVRLEAGEPTDRTETITTDMLDREIARLERELAKGTLDED